MQAVLKAQINKTDPQRCCAAIARMMRVGVMASGACEDATQSEAADAARPIASYLQSKAIAIENDLPHRPPAPASGQSPPSRMGHRALRRTRTAMSRPRALASEGIRISDPVGGCVAGVPRLTLDPSPGAPGRDRAADPGCLIRSSEVFKGSPPRKSCDLATFFEPMIWYPMTGPLLRRPVPMARLVATVRYRSNHERPIF